VRVTGVILGILSDTHGRGEIAARAIQGLKEAGAEAFVHCGDVGGESALQHLAGLRAWFVWGNTDEPGPRLCRFVRSIGLPLPDSIPLRLELAGKSIVVFHGHEPEFQPIAQLARTGQEERVREHVQADYLLFGHSHVRYDRRFGPLRAVNPGALCRARPPSVATLDLEHDRVRFWLLEIDRRTGPRFVGADYHP
jgi:hypothetical protein